MLSVREVEVLVTWLICDTKDDVARRLFIAVSTVHTHLARVRDKYQAVGRPASSKIALLIRAIEDEYCTLDEIARGMNDTPSDRIPHDGSCDCRQRSGSTRCVSA